MRTIWKHMSYRAPSVYAILGCFPGFILHYGSVEKGTIRRKDVFCDMVR